MPKNYNGLDDLTTGISTVSTLGTMGCKTREVNGQGWTTKSS
jgi:hypothetical protein